MLVKTQINANNMRSCFFFFIFLFFVYSLNGQEGACGTQVTEAQIALENLINIGSSKPNESLAQLKVEKAITIYIVKDKEGNTGVTADAIQAAIDRVNATFAPIKLKIRICNTIVIDNYNFNIIKATENAGNLMSHFYNPKTINLFLVSELFDLQNSPVAGYTFMPADLKDAIFLDKDLIGSADIIHQFGHFFNLYHTHETSFGSELVTDVNCNKTGDRCCDTPADPNIGGSVDVNCNYSGDFKDSNKQFYVPSTSNYMSLSNGTCRCVFTNDQLNRIIYSVLNQKKNLW